MFSRGRGSRTPRASSPPRPGNRPGTAKEPPMNAGTPMVENRELQIRRTTAVENTAVLLFAFIAVVALKWRQLEQPPAWDEAFSVHPAAITLAHNGFDLWTLLHEPSYFEGGPNVHAGSLVTLLTAAGYHWFGGSSWLFPLIHLCHIAAAAFCLLTAYRFSRPIFDRPLAALFTTAVLCHPLFHVQAGMMYLEVPLLACTVLALAAWSSERRMAALAWAALAVLVKETGILVAGTLAAASLMDARPWSRRIRWALAATIVPGAMLAALMLAAHAPGGADYHPPLYWIYLRYYAADRLLQVPDLCFFFALSLAVGGLRWRIVLTGLKGVRAAFASSDNDPLRVRRLALGHLMVFVFFAFHLAAPFVFENYLLPRYLVQILPLMFLILLDALRQVTSRHTACAVTIACCGLFLANRGGFFYPRGAHNDFSVAERSEGYRDLLAVQRAGVRALAATPPDVPVFYGLPEHYFTHYPALGYVSAVPSNGHCVEFEAPYNLGRLDDFPKRFFMLYDYAFLGGRQIQSIVQQAAKDPRREVRVVEEFTQGDYQVVLFEVRTRSRRMEPPAKGGGKRGGDRGSKTGTSRVIAHS